jgi:RNA polymerase sigma factor (sigma-70 family)
LSAQFSDIETIKSILDGDTRSFRKLYNKYSRFYLLTCLRYVKTKADAEDMLQEACVKIYRDLYQFDADKASFINWSKKIVINTCLMHLRKKSVLELEDNIFELGINVPVREKAIENLKLEELTSLIHSLPNGYRTVFNMYVIDGYSHNEIAETLGVSSSTSKTQLMKAKKMLQTKIAEKDSSILENYA